METRINKKLKRTAIYLLLVGIIVLSSFTAFRTNDDFTAGRMEIREYVTKNIFPVMKPYRVDFDNKLTADEIKTIGNLRNEFADILETMHKSGLKRGQKKIIASELTKEQLVTIKECKNRTWDVFLQASVIAGKHKSEIQSILDKESKNREKWSTDLEKIVSDYKSSRLLTVNPVVKMNLEYIEPFENLVPAVFVLWNPEKQFIIE